MMLDEVDKLGRRRIPRRSLASALLEVLDPEQNSTFRDNYLGGALRPFARVFIGTANVLDTIPGPLRDRMEVIQLPGYTERGEAPDRAPLPRCRGSSTPTASRRRHCEISDEALRAIIDDYTREAGRAQSRTRDRPSSSATSRCASPKAATDRVRIGARRPRRDPRPAPVRSRSRDAHQRARRRHRPRLDAGGRRHPVHRGDAHARLGQAHPDRPARRGDEGERAGRADAGQGARREPRHRPDVLREIRHPRARARGRHPQGRAERRRGDVHRAGLAAHRAARCARRAR